MGKGIFSFFLFVPQTYSMPAGPELYEFILFFYADYNIVYIPNY